MKIAYEHLIKFIPSRPSIENISEKFFQLGHEHEIENNIFDGCSEKNSKILLYSLS